MAAVRWKFISNSHWMRRVNISQTKVSLSFLLKHIISNFQYREIFSPAVQMIAHLDTYKSTFKMWINQFEVKKMKKMNKWQKHSPQFCHRIRRRFLIGTKIRTIIIQQNEWNIWCIMYTAKFQFTMIMIRDSCSIEICFTSHHSRSVSVIAFYYGSIGVMLCTNLNLYTYSVFKYTLRMHIHY